MRINREKVLKYIDIVENSGMGKKKSLEYIRKYIKNMDEDKGYKFSMETDDGLHISGMAVLDENNPIFFLK